MQWGNWALSYLARAGAADRPSRGRYLIITDIGRALLVEHPEGVTERHWRILYGNANAPHTFKAFPAPATQFGPVVHVAEELGLDPEEQIASGVARINADVADQLLTRILDQEPVFFEQAGLDLLIVMGHGGAKVSATGTQVDSHQCRLEATSAMRPYRWGGLAHHRDAAPIPG